MIQPGKVHRRKMNMLPWSLGRPGSNFFMCVFRIIIHDNMYIQLRRNVCINMPQKLQKRLMTTPLFLLGENAAGCYFQGRKKRQCPMANIIVRIPFRITKFQWKTRLCALKCLALAFFVYPPSIRGYSGL